MFSKNVYNTKILANQTAIDHFNTSDDIIFLNLPVNIFNFVIHPCFDIINESNIFFAIDMSNRLEGAAE
jgi:hypothetical protein